MSAMNDMNHNSHYLKLLNIPIWQSRSNIEEEVIEIEAESQILQETQLVEYKALQPADTQKIQQISALSLSDLSHCTACVLHKGRTQVIEGQGNEHAKLFIITEAPTFNEDLLGKPLVDDAGKLLNNILKALGYKESDVYITPYIKCAPYQEFITQQEEEICSQYLKLELDKIKPEKILLLGRNVAKYLLNSRQPFDDLRQLQGASNILGSNIPVYISYNIHQLLKFPEEKAGFWKDIKRLVKH